MKERGEVCVCSYQQERKYMHVKEINSLDNTQKNEGNHQVIRIYNPFLVSLFLPQSTFSLIAKGTASHFNLSFFPVNLGVVVLEPVIA